MDEDKVIVAYHGTWDGCTYRNGKEEMILVPSLLRTSIEAFLDHVHRIVGSDQAIFKYVLHCVVSHDFRPMKWRILSKQDLDRAKTLFKTPKFFVTVEQKKHTTSSPPIDVGKNFTNISDKDASSCKTLPTSSPPINGGKSFSNISNMKQLVPSQGASGCNFPMSNGGKSHSRFPQLSIPPFLYRASCSSPPVKHLIPNALAENLAESNKVTKVADAEGPVVSESPYRGREGLGLDHGLVEDEDEDSSDDEDYYEEESFEEVVSKMVYDHFGWEHDDYFIPDDDVLHSWPHLPVLIHDNAVIGDINERVLRNRSIPMESTFEEWRPMALSHMLGPVAVPKAYDPAPVGKIEMSGGSYRRFIRCSRCWDEGHTRANCTRSVSLSSPSTDSGFWSSDEVAMSKPKRRCGNCREIGHTKRTCPTWD